MVLLYHVIRLTVYCDWLYLLKRVPFTVIPWVYFISVCWFNYCMKLTFIGLTEYSMLSKFRSCVPLERMLLLLVIRKVIFVIKLERTFKTLSHCSSRITRITVLRYVQYVIKLFNGLPTCHSIMPAHLGSSCAEYSCRYLSHSDTVNRNILTYNKPIHC